MTTLEELTRPLTPAEVRDAIYEALAMRGVSTTAWQPGAVVRTIIAAVAIIISALSRLQAEIARSGFLELSSGAWLTLVARYVYGVERDEGSFATGSVTLTNAGGGIYSGGPGDLVLRTAGGKSFRSTEAYSLAALGAATVAVQAVELGSAGSTGPGTITTLETTLLGVTATNATALVGRDPESDERLREACLAKTGTLSPAGSRDAYFYVARRATRIDGSAIGVTRTRCIADGIGGVDVYVATASGGVTGSAADPETDLGAIADAIHRQVEPLAVTPRVRSAVPEFIAPTYSLWVRDSSAYTSGQVADIVSARLADWLATQPIGGQRIAGTAPGAPGTIYRSALIAVIGSALPGREVRIELSAPSADVALAQDRAPVLGAVTATIYQVAGDVI